MTTATKSFAWYDDVDRAKTQVFALDGAPSFVAGAKPIEWAFDTTDGRALVVGTDGGKSMIEARWHVSTIGPEGARVVASTNANESAWGAARFGDGLVIAVHTPIAMPGATQQQKVNALMGSLDGDHRQLAALAEPTQSALVYLDGEGHVTKREAVGPQRAAGLAVTDDGWMTLLGEGTLRGGLRDAVLIARAPHETSFRLLASSLDTPSGLVQRGSWVCLIEMQSKQIDVMYIVHCFDPGRGLHVQTAPLDGMVVLRDIALQPARVYAGRMRLKGEPRDELLMAALQ